jgi:hypothetical protein
MEENEASLMQLAYSISPSICRPLSSSYMSIRHMEDLKKIRPVILFLIENHSDIFAVNRFSASFVDNRDNDNIITDKTGLLSDIMASAMVIDSSTQRSQSAADDHNKLSITISPPSVSADQTPHSDTSHPSYAKPNLLVLIPTPPTNSDTASTSSAEMDADSGSANAGTGSLTGGESKSLTHSYSDTEWKVLFALVNSKVANYMEFEEKETAEFVNNEISSDLHHVFMQSWTARMTALLAAMANPVVNSASKGDSADMNSSTSSIGLGNKSGSNHALSKSYARRLHRRKMVADCKALRAQIYEFEQEFSKKYARSPKTQDRGNMQAIYSKYRDLKREIRDGAANDIQRVVRGYQTRYRVARENGIPFFHRATSSHNKSSMLSHSLNTSLNSIGSPNAMDVSSSSGNSRVFSFKEVDNNSSNAANTELLNKLRESLDQKKDLKKKLKKFDEDFLEQHGRAPKKVDKEVIRPMYQKYHEV